MVRRTVWLWVVWCAIGALQSASGAATPGHELRILQPDARTSFYVGIAAPASAVAAVRAFNRTLQDISQTYLAGDYPLHLRNITLLPMYIELPEDERFSASVLERTCAALGGRRVAALLVCGGGPAASALVAAASRAGVPVVRASPSHTHFTYTIANELLPLEIRLETTARETLHAVRATLMNTHWHTFTLLAEEDIFTSLSLRKDLSTILSTQPLIPKWLSLPSKYTRRALFRRLAEISRLTRGVVVLICNADYAKMVMDEAKRLNMVEGNFFWLWIDATRNLDVFRNFNNRTHLEDEILDSFEGDKTSDETKDSMDGNVERIKRDSVDNNTKKSDVMRSNTDSMLRILFKNITNLSDGDNIMNVNLFENNDTLKTDSSSISKLNNKISNVNLKGVATSKVKTKLIEKEEETFSIIDRDKNNNRNNLKSETYSKYVNSINLDEIHNSYEKDNIKKRSETKNHVNNEYLSKNKLNPTVHETLQDTARMEDDVDTNKLHARKLDGANKLKHIFDSFPVGLLALHPQPMKTDAVFVEAALRMMVGSLRRVLRACDTWSAQAQFFNDAVASCWQEPSDVAADFSMEFVREMRLSTAAALAGGTERPEVSLTASFALLNLVPDRDSGNTWRQVGQVLGRNVRLHTIVWPGGRLVAHGQSASARTIFRIVTALAPPFVMEGELDEDGQCLRGLPCHRPQTSDRDNLTMAFNEFVKEQGQEDAEDFFFPTQNPTGFSKMATHCCYGLAMDLLENIAHELEFDFHLYIVEDGMYGSRKLVKSFHQLREYKSFLNQYIDIQQTPQASRNVYKYLVDPDNGGADYLQDEGKEEDYEKWNGIMGDLVSGAAHMSFAALSVSSARAEVIDFSQPYFFSGVSILAAPKQKADIPLLAFLLPFSPELWIAIFTSLNVTAIAVAIYEWLSPFGLNPWGRQRSKNFSISSALWVMWGLLCGHLVAFKAPKSWPNKFLINVWGGFSVIFVASYTANIAALIAGLFFHNAVDDFQGRSNWLSLRVGTAKSSIAEYYVQRNNPQLAQQMRRYALQNVEEGIGRLRNGTLDLLIADTPILDYYRATDHGCKLQRVGDHTLAEDTYAIGMSKGFPLKDSISAVIAKYSSNGYMDILTEKWYGGLPCFKLSSDYGIQPKPLGVAAVAGVFLLLGVGMIVGCLILIMEHLFYKYTLPILRHKPNGTIWRSRNIMFFSQKLYRFINCVELVSPHHAARELVNTIKQGHLTSLFQKSVKRKEHEQRRRRKSKAQFFEMIQEIRRVQQESLDSIKEHATMETSVSEQATDSKLLTPSPEVSGRSPRQGRSPRPSRSPKQRRKRCSLAGLNVRRFSTDSILGSDSGSIYERTSLNIGRRLSRDVSFLTSSPPDINTRLRTPSPMVRRIEGPSTKSNQDVSDRIDHDNMPNSSSRASIEILISHDDDIPPIPPYPKTSIRSTQVRGIEEELIRLWRSSERDVQESLLAALRDQQLGSDPQEDPG